MFTFTEIAPLVERLRTDVLRRLRRGNDTTAKYCQDAEYAIERAWAARDAAVSDLDANTSAEVRRAVAAERERCARIADAEWVRDPRVSASDAIRRANT